MSNLPIILAFDTSAAHCAAVLLRGNDVISRQFEEIGRGQVERLFPLLEEVMGTVKWSDLTAIAIGIGPGNFTGTRIAVSAARGLAMSLNIPAIGVSNFEAGAMVATPDNDKITICIALPREQFGTQVFSAGSPPIALSAPKISTKKTVGPIPFDVENIARFAALRLAQNQPIPRPAPLYLRPADAAPAKIKPPVILDDR
ncbi:MAG: tRNA (adenosine(37)-N6)-threonylcarbamoyltransferase complex dimerization subunit type 1 TsaB [Rhodobacteraceae bacterium]|nr:tRNA (adenosine(37)-N6)-threonylcarbamoyltransferase complex dimerization subunit type 1 TsaB [Paracoccaceae bacterium]